VAELLTRVYFPVVTVLKRRGRTDVTVPSTPVTPTVRTFGGNFGGTF